jgi:tellurite resistance protein TerC
MHDIANGWLWLGFSLFLVFALSVDTLILDKKHARPHQSIRAALIWTFVWITCALVFNALLWVYLSVTSEQAVANEVALTFFTGYLIEKSLSVDNLFVFYMIFKQLHIPLAYQQRVLSYGIWGAIIMRLLLILLGAWLVREFHWVLYLMGAFLLLTGCKMLFIEAKERDLSQSVIIKIIQRFFRVTHELHEEHFFIRKNALFYATPLFVAVVFVEISDLIFAFDSIPAIFAITQDPFIVWSSNIFAILGLRAMYFLLAGVISRFDLLKYGIALILIFVGFKMVIEPWVHVSIGMSLGFIAGVLVLFTVASVMREQGR